MLQKVIIRDGSVSMPSNPIISFPYEPDACQKHAFHAIEQNNDMLLNWPTGTGKTTPAIYAILHTVKRLGKRVVYTTPIKSLSNEKFNDFTHRFAEYGVTVGILTGDNKINPDANCIMATAEILRNSLFQSTRKINNSNYSLDTDFVNSIGCVIMDEIHYMNDEERGNVWETTIIKLDPSIQLIMLSGTVGNPRRFCKWISYCRQRTVSLITETKRIVPLTHHIFVNKNSFQFMDQNNVYSTQQFHLAETEFKERKKQREKAHKSFDERYDIMEMTNYLKHINSFPAIFFSFSKEKCETYADIISDELKNSLLTQEEQEKLAQLIHKHLGSQKTKYQHIGEVEKMFKLLKLGVAYHHSHVLQNLRELVEILMKEKLIKILFATETLCIGVNVPVKTCILTGLTKFTKDKKRTIHSSEYRQMTGRAGRRGMDLFGLVYVLPLREFPYETELTSVISENDLDIKSNFKLNYQFILKFSQINDFDIINFFNKSLKNFENVDQIELLNKEKQNLQQVYFDTLEELSSIVLDDNQMSVITKLIYYEQKIKYGITLTKQQDKEKKLCIIEKDKNEHIKKKYNLMIRQAKLEEQISSVTEKIAGYEKHIESMYTRYRKILTEWGYVLPSENKLICNKDITTRGVICAQINDCNAILVTEIVCEKYMIDLTPVEIVALISLFADTPSKDTEVEPNQKYSKVYKCIEDLEYLIEECKTTEKKYLAEFEKTDYAICKDYIDMSYAWASGKSITEMGCYFDKYKIPTEAFCKNMIRISNILVTLSGIYDMIKQDIEMIPKLEEANKLIMRDIVCVTSLYLR